VKGWEKIYQVNDHQKQAGVAVFISEKLEFKPKLAHKQQRSSHHTNKRSNTSRESKNYQLTCD
jgi:hypothetical protein